VVPAGELLIRARQWALDIVESHKPRLITLQRLDKLESFGEARKILQVARAQSIKKSPNLPQLLYCLDAIEAGVVSGGYAGSLKVEYSNTILNFDLIGRVKTTDMDLNRKSNVSMMRLCLQLGKH
jgi:hypothetical protein